MRTGGLLIAIGLMAHSGCSLIYKDDGFSKEEPIPPVDPINLTLTEVEPSTVLEGAGCLPGASSGTCAEGSRPIAVVVRGENIAADARVTLMGPAPFGGQTPPVFVSKFHDSLAFTLSVPVNLAKASGTDTIEVLVAQADGTIAQSASFTVQYLPELVASQVGSPTLAVTSIAALYSFVHIDVALALTGTTVPRVRATSNIRVSNVLSVNGQSGDAGGGNASLPGPGGCAGAAAAGVGACGTMGGGGGGATLIPGVTGQHGGGGGGGGAANGGNGVSGTTPGAGGQPAGDEMMPELDFAVGVAGTRGSGGGGGGMSSGNVGAPGGGGGGSIELTSNQVVTFDGSGAVQAKGGPGGIGTVCGSGGGGSGGVVLVRGVVGVDGAGNVIDVSGGAGGARASCVGGAGSAGRVRIDAPVLNVGAGAVTPTRGPAWIELPVVYTGFALLPIQLTGGGGRTYGLRQNGEDKGEILVGGNTAVTLVRGFNSLCALVLPDPTLEKSEAINCLDIVYMPAEE